jgi:hypothetical protein
MRPWFRGARCSPLGFPVRRVTPIVPALAPAKMLRSGAPAPTKRRSSRVPRAAAVAGEPPRNTVVATGPQQEVGAVAATTVAATAVASVSPSLIPAAGDQAVVDIADDNAPPPGWGQWDNRPASAPEPTVGVLVMREDGCVMAQRPAHDAEASSSRVVLPTPDVVVALQCRSGVTPARRRVILTRPRPSRRCGKSFETTVPRSTLR